MRRITSLKDKECRYPVSGDRKAENAMFGGMPFARHLFCGLPASSGSSYCEKHAKLCAGPDAKDWEALFDTITAMEHSVGHVREDQDV
jgi:hypothetical protein